MWVYSIWSSLLSWDLHCGYHALRTLKVIKDECSLLSQSPFLSDSFCRKVWLRFQPNLNFFFSAFVTMKHKYNGADAAFFYLYLMKFDLWFIRSDLHFPTCPSSWRLPVQVWLISECIFQICFIAFFPPLLPYFWKEATRGKKWSVNETQNQRFNESWEQPQGASR